MSADDVLGPTERERALAPVDPEAGPVDVVIDTDATNEVDDEFAVVWALLRPDRLRVRALLACPYSHGADVLALPGVVPDLDRAVVEAALAGGVELPEVSPSEGVRRAAAELRRLVDVVGTSTPVHVGPEAYLPDVSTPVESEAARALVDLAHADRDGPLHVLAMGCATTVASALLLDPSIVSRVVVVWTSAHPTWWPRATQSYNLAQDVPAAQVLLRSGVPLVYLPGYTVGEELRVTVPEVRAHLAGHGPVADYLLSTYTGHPAYGSAAPGASKVLWDLVCTAWLVDPSWLASELRATPSLHGGGAGGDKLRWGPPAEGAPLLREAYDVNRDAVVGDLFRVVQADGARRRRDG